MVLGKGPSARVVEVPLDKEEYNGAKFELVASTDFPGRYIFRNCILKVDNSEGLTPEEVGTRIKHFVLKKEKEFSKISKEVEAFEQMTETENARRERIPDSVKMFVWQRDEGKCATCGSKEKLEFDHIIPIAEGGSNTERNIQILCESCNRTKGKSIS